MVIETEQGGKERRLLILDDDPDVGEALGRAAERFGVSAAATVNAVDFFRALEDWDPTHIVLDLVMPGMDGVEVLLQLASRGCRARIILASGVGHQVLDAARRAAAEHGLDIAGVLPKPSSPGDLFRLLGGGAPSPRQGTPHTNGRLRRPTGDFEPGRAELKGALDRGEMTVHYQPKVDCVTGALAGFEALVRWLHPQHGTIPPDRFIPVAESTGLIDLLTDQVLLEAVAWFSDALARGDRQAGRTPISLAVNLSPRTLSDPGFVDRVAELCHVRGLPCSRLSFELTETSAMEDPAASLGLLTRLRMKGFQLSIDDFGTGYSSMLQLVRLPFTEVKVDRSFVMTSAHSKESRTVIASIVELARSLGMATTGEGVEDERSLSYLRDVGCDLAQGYFFARPVPGEVAERWILGEVPPMDRGPVNHGSASGAID